MDRSWSISTLLVILSARTCTSLNLQCYLCLSLNQDGKVRLNVPDLELCRTWSISDIAHQLRMVDDDAIARLDVLKELAGLEREDEVLLTPAMATLMFLFLLVSIYGAQLE